MVTALVLAAVLTASASMPGEPTFSGAYLSLDRLCFDSPIPVDWEALARRELKASEREVLRQEQLEPHMFWDDSTFMFTADVPEDFRPLHFYLLTERGIQPITPEGLRVWGTINYHRYAAAASPTEEVVHGEVCLPVPPAVEDAGFVAAVARPVEWQLFPATIDRSGSRTLVRRPNGDWTLPSTGHDTYDTEVRAAYVFSAAGLPAQYLLVRRAESCPPICCRFPYDVYRWEPGLPVLASNACAGAVGPDELLVRGRTLIDDNCGDCHGGTRSGLEEGLAAVKKALDLGLADRVAAHKALADGYNTLALVYAVPDSEDQRLILGLQATSYQRLIELAPRDPQVRFDYALFLSDPTLSLEQLEEATRLAPSWAQARFLLAMALTETGAWDRALLEARTAIAGARRHDVEHYGQRLAEMFELEGRSAEAKSLRNEVRRRAN